MRHNVALILTAIWFCVGCSTRPVVVAKPVPHALLAECSPELLLSLPAGTTVGGLALYSIQLRSALRGCNADKRALQDWAKGS